MISATSRTAPLRLPVLVPGIAFGLAAALLVSHLPAPATLAALGGLLLLLVSFFYARLAIFLIIFSMLLSPEIGFGLNAGSRPVTVRLEDLLLILVGLAWLARLAYYKELGPLRDNPLKGPILAYSLAATLATLVSGWTSEINWLAALLFLAKYLEYFVLYFVVLGSVRDRDDVKRYLAAALLTCAIVSVVGIVQIPSGVRVTAPFEGEVGEPNTLGGYLVFMLALASGFALNAGSTRERFLWLAFMALISLPLLYTLSRSSWLAAGAALAVLVWLSPRRGQVVSAALLLLLMAPVLFPRQVFDRVEYTFEQPPSPGQIEIGRTRLDTSLSARLRSWRHGLSGWARRPLTGYGVAGYGFMDAQYVRILTETGIFGLAAFVWLAGRIFRLALHQLRHAPDRFSKALGLGYMAGYVALLVHGLGANTFIIVRIMEPFWLVTALVFMLPRTAADAGGTG